VSLGTFATLFDVDRKYEKELQNIVAYLQSIRPTDIIVSNACSLDLAETFKDWPDEGKPIFEKISGLLHFPISSDGVHFFSFLRLENVHILQWGGDPNQPFYFDEATGQFHPRQSFQVCREEVHGRSIPWTESQISLAQVLQKIYRKFDEIWRQNERSANLDRLKNMMIANVSHEIRTPLHSIINFSELALESQNLAQDVRSYIHHACEAGHRLISTINDLLDLARLDCGRAQLRQITYDLRRTFQSAHDLFKRDSQKKGLDLNFEYSPNIDSIPLIFGDEGKLWQSLVNIIGNAVKYTERGSIQVKCNVKATSKEEGELEVKVFDTGVGIPESQLPTIFEAFVRLEGSSLGRRPIEGTGLGLAIVARLMKLQGGTLKVTSTEGEGSCFTFTLPLKFAVDHNNGEQKKDQAVPSSSNVSSSASSPISKSAHKSALTPLTIPQKLHLLVAEDNPLNQEILRKRLEKDGHDVMTVRDGRHCLDEFQLSVKEDANGNMKSDYDVILMDIQVINEFFSQGFDLPNGNNRCLLWMAKKPLS
jgi:signal transduction histidine kinase